MTIAPLEAIALGGAFRVRNGKRWCRVYAAVRAGELDELLDQQMKTRDVPRAKRAA
jgi:hypothetical protein